MHSVSAFRKKLRNHAGRISRATAIVLALVVLMLLVVSVPVYQYYKAQAAAIGCLTSLDTAQRQMTNEFLFQSGDLTYEEAHEFVDYVMVGWERLCPGGGTVHLVYDKDAEMPYRVACGIHDQDHQERTRLNAAYVKDRLEHLLARTLAKGDPIPEEMTVQLNGKELIAQLVDEYSPIRRGTGTTPGYEGTVCYYGVVGHSDFGTDSGMKDGELWYFVFADEDYCAVWTQKNGWTGDSYMTQQGVDQVWWLGAAP